MNPQPGGEAARWWREWQAGLLVLLVAAVYFPRMTALSIRGEEPRWATVAREMIRTGDWLVVRQQGEPLFSRPPLGCWLIAAAALARGDCDLVAVRLPTLLATLATALLVYAYSRIFLTRFGAFSAGAAYATMAQVLELGRLAETEATFTLLLGGSLLAWHWGYLRWRAAGWVAGYGLAALAALAKGPQAPVYFAATVGAYLLLTGGWREALSRRHLLGVLVFALLLGAWLVPYGRAVGWDGVRATWTSDTAMRFLGATPASVVKHLLSYPLEILVCTMPWSPLLALFASRRLRASLGPAAPAVLFLATALAVTFPTCWFVPGARGRYFMSLYPCLAPLIGLVVERCAGAAPREALGRAWRLYLRTCAAGMLAVAGVVAAAALLPLPGPLSQPPAFAAVYAVVAAGLAGLTAWSSVGAPKVGVLSLAAFLGLTGSGLVLNGQRRKSEDATPAVAQLKASMPPGQRLVSYGPAHNLFLYYYGQPVELRPWPAEGGVPPADEEYFCFSHYGGGTPALAFAWEEVGVVPCDRYRSSQPFCRVVVGRRPVGAARR